MTRARSARLRQIRNARGKSLRVVAGLAGMSPAHLSRRPAEALRARVTTTIDALCRCERERDVGTALPSLIRDLHTTIAVGRDVAELLSLGAWLHTQATVPWLSITAAPVDLRWQALMLTQHAAGDRNTVATAGLVAAASARVGLAAGAVDSQAHVNRSGQAAVRVPSLASNTTSLIAVTVVTCDHRRH